MAKNPRSCQVGHGRRLVACALCALPLVLAGCGSTVVAPPEPPPLARQPVPTFTPLPSPTATRAPRATAIPPTATATPTIFVPPTPTPLVYTVKQGDTLALLAGHFGVTLEQLMGANGIADAATLAIGQQLVIPVVANEVAMALAASASEPEATTSIATVAPSASAVPTSTPGASTHYVQVGETLSVIANIHGVGIKDLLLANGLAPDSQLTAGDTLLIPQGTYTPVPTVTPIRPTETPTVIPPTALPTETAVAIAAVPGTATPAPSATPTLEPTPVVYEVQQGDMPAMIASTHGVSTEALLAANPGKTEINLRPGDLLIIPAAQGGAVAAGQPSPSAAPVSPTATPDLRIITEHTIAAGETITDIFARYNVSYQQLTAYNNIVDSNNLPVGEVLRIPLGTPTPTPTVVPSPTLSPTPLPAYLPPVPLMPINGVELTRGGGGTIVLSWAASGLLKAGEYYFVRLQTFDSSGVLVSTNEDWLETTSWRVPNSALPSSPGKYTMRWSVLVARPAPTAARRGAVTSEPQAVKHVPLSEPSGTVEFRLDVPNK